jgi:hypothetical protein
MAADRPYGEFYDFYSVSPEYFGYTLVDVIPLPIFHYGVHDDLIFIRSLRLALRSLPCPVAPFSSSSKRNSLLTKAEDRKQHKMRCTISIPFDDTGRPWMPHHANAWSQDG